MSTSKSDLRRALLETLVDLTIGQKRVAAPASARRVDRVRTWVASVAVFFVPLLTYWPATFHSYGLRDDYSNLREAHEEAATVLKFCASHARPIYGLLLEFSYGQTTSVENLQWMRCGASLLLGALGLAMLRGLRALGWSFRSSFLFAALLALIPAAQVIAGWAVGWPYAATALLAIAAFFAAESAIAQGRTANLVSTGCRWTLALCVMVVAALTYQPSAMFYLVPLAGALIARPQLTLRQLVHWLGLHLTFVFAALAVAYQVMTSFYSAGIFAKSARVAFEHHWGSKLAWFVSEPLPNALSMLVLNDEHGRDFLLYLACAATVGLLLAAGAAAQWRQFGRTRGLVWIFGLLALPILAFTVSLLASERYATYRTILAMTGVLLCFLVASVSVLTTSWPGAMRKLLSVAAVSIAFFMAQHHVYDLIAVPQGNEWQLIVQGAMRVRLDGAVPPRIFALASKPADISTATIYHDEFGSLSSNSEWVPKEMFKDAMHDLHPGTPDIESRYVFHEGYYIPANERYDVLIDMQRLRRLYVDN